jgi:hypothetical protein
MLLMNCSMSFQSSGVAEVAAMAAAEPRLPSLPARSRRTATLAVPSSF